MKLKIFILIVCMVGALMLIEWGSAEWNDSLQINIKIQDMVTPTPKLTRGTAPEAAPNSSLETAPEATPEPTTIPTEPAT